MKGGMQTSFCKENYLKMNKIVYRFEHSTNKDLGLWYMRDGSESGFVLIEYEVSEYLEDGPQTLFTKEGVVSEKVIPYNEW